MSLKQRTVRFTGAVYFIIIAGSFLIPSFVDSPLAPIGDIAEYVNNILANELKFRIAIAGDLIMFIFVMMLSWGLYQTVKRVDKKLAQLAFIFRFAEGVLGGVVTLVGSIATITLLKGSADMDIGNLYRLIELFDGLKTAGFYVLMIFMGIGGIIFFYLFFKSKYIPGFLSLWGIVTYLIMFLLSFAKILFPGIPQVVSMAIFAPGALFEALIGLWLMIKGVRVTQDNVKQVEF